jgi:8-oxo-dGTP pyrophosphatase MutT (NUDIX family)
MEESVPIQPAEALPREAARVLVIDPAGRVLLLENFDPARPQNRFWVTVGGGVDGGEEAVQAAVRELREETGIAAAVDELTGPVWHRSTEFSFDGTRYQQEEDYFLLRVREVQVSFAHLEPDERRFTTGYRWWSRDELAAAADPFYPSELPEILRRLPVIDGGKSGSG